MDSELIWSAQLHFYSTGDEDAFFNWLQSIPEVISVTGKGRELFIRLRSPLLPSDSLRELIGIYWRYGGRMCELAQFADDSNRAWFQDPKQFWYQSVFNTEPVDAQGSSEFPKNAV